MKCKDDKLMWQSNVVHTYDQNGTGYVWTECKEEKVTEGSDSTAKYLLKIEEDIVVPCCTYLEVYLEANLLTNIWAGKWFAVSLDITFDAKLKGVLKTCLSKILLNLTTVLPVQHTSLSLVHCSKQPLTEVLPTPVLFQAAGTNSFYTVLWTSLTATGLKDIHSSFLSFVPRRNHLIT